MQISGSFPLQFLNNPNPARAPDAGQTRQAPGNGVQNNAITPATAVHAAAQAQPEAPAATAAQANTTAQARPATHQATPSATPPAGGAAISRLDLYA